MFIQLQMTEKKSLNFKIQALYKISGGFMKIKTMKILGILFIVIGSLGIAGSIFLWFFNYWAMDNGYYYFGDSIMEACAISMLFGFLLAPGIPFLIVSSVRKKRRQRNENANKNLPERVKFCSYCGAKHRIDADFCGKCGSKLENIKT